MQSGLLGCVRKIRSRKDGGLPEHRDGSSGKPWRRIVKMSRKSNWYQHQNLEKDQPPNRATYSKFRRSKARSPANVNLPLSVLMVPRTPGGCLMKALRDQEQLVQKTGKRRWKLTEQAGDKLQSMLTRVNPWGAKPCQRIKCTTCRHGMLEDKWKPSHCHTRSVVYRNFCVPCRKAGMKKEYWGETSSSIFERALKHHEDARYKPASSHIFHHITEDHPNEVITEENTMKMFKMEVISIHRSALEREVKEARVINNCPFELLNSREEYNACIIPKIMVENFDIQRGNIKKRVLYLSEVIFGVPHCIDI